MNPLEHEADLLIEEIDKSLHTLRGYWQAATVSHKQTWMNRINSMLDHRSVISGIKERIKSSELVAA